VVPVENPPKRSRSTRWRSGLEMGFASKWASVVRAPEARTGERTPIRIIRTIRTIQDEPHEKGNSANTANIASRGSTPNPSLSPPDLVPPSTSSLEALARFEADPRGVMSWLAQQSEGQPQDLFPRWTAVIQAEARMRLAEVEE
jgi:hypothetical protein